MVLFVSLFISVLIFLLKDKLAGLESYGLLGLFVISVIGNATIVFPAPVILSAFVAGAIFNPLAVTVAVSAGATVGELTGYYAGFGGTSLVGNEAKLKKIKTWIDKFGLWVIFVLAVIPNPLFDLAGIVAGATGIPVWKYLIVVFAGKFIKFGIFAFLGAGSTGLIDKFL